MKAARQAARPCATKSIHSCGDASKTHRLPRFGGGEREDAIQVQVSVRPRGSGPGEGGSPTTDTLIAERLVDIAYELSQGKTEGLRRIAEAQGKSVTQTEDGGTVIVRSDTQTAGICLGAGPVDQLPALILALWGPLGFMLEPARLAFKLMTKRARDDVRRKRAGTNGAR